MAILKDFIDQVTFDQVWAILNATGSEETAQYQDSFAGIFGELQAAVPAENREHMSIRFVLEEASEWDFWFSEDEEAESEGDDADEEGATLQVYGFIPGDDEGYAIGMKQPAAIVALDVDPETVAAYSPAEIVAHCISEIVYTSTVASSAFGTEKDTAGGGLLASQVCMEEDIQNVDLNALRREIGAIPEHEDYKSKYGFLF